MNESTRDWSPNKDRGSCRQRGGSEDDEDEDFMHALTHSPSQQDRAHTQHTPQASPKKRSTQSMQPQLGKRKRGKPSNAERGCAARAAAAAAAATEPAAAAAAEAPLP